MNSKYDAAIYIRIVGIILSIISLSLAFIKPFDFVLNTALVYSLLVGAAILIMIGDLIVIKSAPDEEFSNRKERKEAIYDVITTAIVVGLFVIFYVVPFFSEHLW
ncbi:MAG: hypothetical protein V4611_04580 [Patescibacteria group bacterium]